MIKMALSDVWFVGYLGVLTKVGLDIKRKAKNEYCVLHRDSERSLARLDLYETEEEFEEGSKGSTLLYCNEIQDIFQDQTDGEPFFKLTTAQASYTFVCKSHVQQKTWLSALWDVTKKYFATDPRFEVSNPAWRGNIASREGTHSAFHTLQSTQAHCFVRTLHRREEQRGGTLPSNRHDDSESHVGGRRNCLRSFEEESDHSKRQYDVRILETAESKRFKLTGSYRLEITDFQISLMSRDDYPSNGRVSPILVWHYPDIKTFGYSERFFKLEADPNDNFRGKRAARGTFAFETSEGQEILDWYRANVKTSC